MRNCIASESTANNAEKIAKQYSPIDQPSEFAKANMQVSKQHLHSLGLALGYCYDHSPIITNPTDDNRINLIDHYQPLASLGVFAPHIKLNTDYCLYDILPVGYTLLAFTDLPEDLEDYKKMFEQHHLELTIILLPPHWQNIYPQRYYLLRPDWHIAWHGNQLPKKINELLNYLS